MKILSLYWGICASASIFVNGKVVAAVHEERFSRIKNDDAFPRQAIQYCLDAAGLVADELDGVAIASYEQGFDFTVLREAYWTVEDYLREQREYWYPVLYEKQKLSKIEVLADKVDFASYPEDYWKKNYKQDDRNEIFCRERENIVANYLNIPSERVFRIEHHRCHAAYAYYSSPFRNQDVLALTIDAYGDGLNATIGVYDSDGIYTRKFSTGDCYIGRIYRYMTLLLGMKPNEHEFKVMGLAPYGKEKYAKRALQIFKDTLLVDGVDFKWKIKPTDSYYYFKELLEGVRFDNIAWALQTWVEDLLLEWVQNSIRKFGINKVVISGGVAMNIKAMGKIAELPEVDEIFIGGSGSDESMAISSGICLAEDLAKKEKGGWDPSAVQNLPHLYLGPQATIRQEQEVIDAIASDKYKITQEPASSYIANLLADGVILARCAGRMEFGQRALGNRSILADPISLRVKEKINSAIKNRDFWMPFAPVIMDKYVDVYLKNPKKIFSPHMTIGFETTEIGYEAMAAACHPADKTARPQMLSKEINPELYDIMEEFEKLTGRGALLNTSFNLHGYPIVNTPQEAFDVFENSGLDALLLGDFLILKNKSD